MRISSSVWNLVLLCFFIVASTLLFTLYITINELMNYITIPDFIQILLGQLLNLEGSLLVFFGIYLVYYTTLMAWSVDGDEE